MRTICTISPKSALDFALLLHSLEADQTVEAEKTPCDVFIPPAFGSTDPEPTTQDHLDLMIGLPSQPLATWELPLNFLGHGCTRPSTAHKKDSPAKTLSPMNATPPNTAEPIHSNSASGSELNPQRLSAGHFSAYRLSDHRPIYLDYQGQISDGRGFVRQIARGEVTISYFATAKPNDSGQQLSGYLVQLASRSLHARLIIGREDFSSQTIMRVEDEWMKNVQQDALSTATEPKPFPPLDSTDCRRRKEEWKFYVCEMQYDDRASQNTAIT